MSNNKILNIAIIGFGSIGKRHAMAIDKLNNINLCGVVDLDLQKSSACKSKSTTPQRFILSTSSIAVI